MEFENDEFSWLALFLVTAACCVFFNVLLKLVEGNFSTLLFIVAGVAALLGAGNYMANAWGLNRKK